MAKSQGRAWIEKNYPPAMLCPSGIMQIDNQYNIYFNDLLSCVYKILIFEGMPETIDQTYFKMCLFLGGRVAIFRDTKGDGAIRALDCATAGEPNIYYMPREIIIVNPTFRGYSYNLKPGEDVAVVFCRECDRYQYARETGGLFGLISSTAQLLADNTISINVATKNMRLCNILAADDDLTVKSMQIALDKMYRGDPYVIAQKSLVDSLESIPVTAQTNTQQLLQLLQTRQYILSHFYEQIGLKTHDQMKKERLITSEIDEGVELAVFNISDMIAEVQRGLDEANRIFGLDIKMRVNPLISSALDQTDDAEGDAQSDAAGDDQTGEPAQPAEPEENDGDFMRAIYQAAAQRVADMIRGQPAELEDDAAGDDQTDDAAGDDQTDDAAGDDQTDDAAGDDQTDDAAGDDQTDDAAGDDQTDDAAGDDQTEGAQDVTINIDGDVNGDISIDMSGGETDEGLP